MLIMIDIEGDIKIELMNELKIYRIKHREEIRLRKRKLRRRKKKKGIKK